MPSEQYIISGRGRRNACHYRTKRRWKIHSGKDLIGIQTPDSGKITLDGQDITELDINHRANAGIGFAIPAATEI